MTLWLHLDVPRFARGHSTMLTRAWKNHSAWSADPACLRQGPSDGNGVRGGIAACGEKRDAVRNNKEGQAMTLRVPMVSLERARELGDAMGMPARRTTSEAFRVVANNPGVARVAFGQLMQLLENNKFDIRLRELMIMRIGWVTGSAYEWTQHWRVATTAGIPPEDILAVRDWRNAAQLTPADRAILAATDECLAGKSISDAVWAEVTQHVTDPAEQVEFIIAMGNWMAFSMLFRTLRIPLAEGVAVWPPDGLASPAAAN
jgi:alkylhydroperoxidase family enzyme